MTENAVGKVQYQFLIQTHSKLGIAFNRSEIKVSACWFLLGALRKNPFHAFLRASGGCQLSLASWAINTSLLPLCLFSRGFSSVCVNVFCLSPCPDVLLLLRTTVIALGPMLIQYDLILTLLYLPRPYFQKKPDSKVSGQEFGDTRTDISLKRVYRWKASSGKDIQLREPLGKYKLKQQRNNTTEISEWQKDKLVKTADAGVVVEELDYSFIADRNRNWETRWKTQMSYQAMESHGGNLTAFN